MSKSKNQEIEVLRNKPISSYVDVFRNIIGLFRYFTIWMLVIDILYLTGVVKGIEFFLITVHIFIILFCAYIFYFKFKKFKTHTYSLDLVFRGKILGVIDFIFHYIPLILIIKYMRCRGLSVRANKINILLVLIIPGLYFLLNDARTIYFLRESKSFTFFTVYLLALFTVYFSFYQ
ncbi:MAG: hypothetical protein CL678_08425 [Bdellovibrionaceae bacterium]|nr:hypothetical protein [Pseudobdellovibrionaceae bacterium]